MKTRISKAYRGDKHIGFKKTVGGHEWFLGYGTSPGDEAKAITLAEVLEAKWRLAKAGGQSELAVSDFEDVKALIAGQPRHEAARASVHEMVGAGSSREHATASMPASPAHLGPVPQELNHLGSRATPAPGSRRWLYASIDEFVSTTKRSLKPDGSNGDHVFNTCERILRARDAMKDVPLDLIRRKELDDWLLEIRALPSKLNGKGLGAVTVRNIVSGVRAALIKFAEWEWWMPPPLWERAFKGYSIKKLQTPAERKHRKKKPPAHSVDEKRVLWHLSLPFEKAMMAMADWAGHTQKEVATLTFDEIIDDGIEMIIDRDRHKTGIHGRWWIPPEAAAVIREVVARTPKNRTTNPDGLAFLTPQNKPLVHRADKNKRSRSDYVGSNLWGKLLRAARHYGVRHISYKFMRKGTAQLIRDKFGKEVSRTFLAQADEDVQDEAYTRASLHNVEEAVRYVYPKLEGMFQPVTVSEWDGLRERIRNQTGYVPEHDHAEQAG